MLVDTEATNTRERVLRTLLARERCTINELAEAVNINPISVRHHISRLEAEGLVASQEERHGVGRPRRWYFLTEKGRERFPTRYIRLTVRLLEQLKETLPKEMVSTLFTQIAREMASDYAATLEGQTLEERLRTVAELLAAEGFTVEIERQGDFLQIREVNCPYFHVSQNHPEICAVDQTLISTLLDSPAQKVQCVLHGDAHCTYLVSDPQTTEEKPHE